MWRKRFTDIDKMLLIVRKNQQIKIYPDFINLTLKLAKWDKAEA